MFCQSVINCACVVGLRVRLRSDGAAIPRRRSATENHSPPRGADTPPRAAACPSSPHKAMLSSRSRVESPDKRRLGTFGSAGTINYPERKVYGEGHPLRPSTGTRHSSLGDHKSLEAEALAEVRILLNMCIYSVNILYVCFTLCVI